MTHQKFMLTAHIIGRTRTVTTPPRRVKRQQPADSLKPRLSARATVSTNKARLSAPSAGDTSARIHGLLAESFTTHQSTPEASPTEIIDQRDAGVIDDTQMLTRLTGLEYSFDRFPNAGNIESAAYVPGTWNEVEAAFAAGRITRDQYVAVMNAHRDEIIAAVEHL